MKLGAGLRALWALSMLFCLLGARRAHADAALTLWHAYGGAEEAGLEEAVARFRAAHPDVQVELLGLPFGAYAAKLEGAIPAGRGPDLFIDAHERLPFYRERGLVSAAPVLAAAGSAFEPRHVAALEDAGTLYGLPLAVKAAVLYVNTKLVPDPGTVTSLEALAQRAPTLPQGSYALVFEADNPYYLAAFLHAEGSALLDERGSYGFVGPRAEAVLGTLRAWADRGVMPKEPNAELMKRLFRAGRAAAMIGGPWLAPDLPAALSYRVLPLPPLSDGKAPLAPYVTVESLYFGAGRGRTAQRERALAELAAYLTYDEGARVRASVGGQVVASRTAAAEDSPFAAVVRKAAAVGVPMPTHPHMRRVWEPAQRAAKKALRGGAAIAEALREGERRFADAVRPLPAPRSPTPLLVVLGLALVAGAALLGARARSREFRTRLRASLPAYAYVAHAAVAVLLLVVAPLAVGAVTSLFAGRGKELYYVGFANYADILSARGGPLFAPGSFWLVLAVTLLWTASNLVLHVVLGVSLALLVNRLTPGWSRLYRVLLVMPWAVPNYVTALAWKGMFHQQFGSINALFAALGGEPISWFAQWSTAFTANLATNTWLGFPFTMVVTLGALTAIPREVYEAAAVDGASGWDQTLRITLPMIRPVLAPAIAMGAVWTFNMFNVVFLVSGGEPDGTTEILVSEAYRWAFTRSSQYGYAAAYAVLIFGLLVLGTRMTDRILARRTA